MTSPRKNSIAVSTDLSSSSEDAEKYAKKRNQYRKPVHDFIESKRKANEAKKSNTI